MKKIASVAFRLPAGKEAQAPADIADAAAEACQVLFH